MVNKKNGKGKKVALLFFTLLIILVLGAAGAVYFFMGPIDKTDNTIIEIEIPKGSSTSAIANILADAGLIYHDQLFKLQVKRLGLESELKAGNYEFSKSMTLEEIIGVIVEGNKKIESVRFTIPEGYNIVQIATKLADEGLVNRDRFIELAKIGDFDYPFVKAIPNDKNIKYRLEGYLFPETYEIKVGATEEEIIERMLNQFAKEWQSDWDGAIAERTMTLHEAVTLASIIEREIMVDFERPIAAGVFTKRLKENWRLESCATVQYVLGKQKAQILDVDMEIQDPYNTYRNSGLPPGPIGSPGRASLDATVHPDNNPYYFFVTKKDGTNTHHFSKTYEEHLKYDAQSRGTW